MTVHASTPQGKSAFFRPWLGNAYQTQGLAGTRLLILGESHYGDDRNDEVPDPETTNLVVRGHLANPTSFRLFGSVEQLITGVRLHDPAARDEFWQRVIFCNLVQRLLRSRKAEHRPVRADWEAGRRAFVHTLREHRPDAVLVLGVGTWNALSGDGFVGSLPVNADASSGLYEWQVAPDHTAVATWVEHPTGSHGFRMDEGRFRVAELLARARGETATPPE